MCNLLGRRLLSELIPEFGGGRVWGTVGGVNFPRLLQYVDDHLLSILG